VTFGLITLISAYFWLRQRKGKSAAHKYAYSIFFIFIFGIGYMVVDSRRTRAEYEHIIIGGLDRQYRIFLPSSYIAGKQVPLVLALHGGSGSAKQFESSSGYDAVAEKYGFIVVYPDGVGTFEFAIHVWNSGHLQNQYSENVNDVLFLTNLIAEIKADYSINSSRVYMTGHSNGAMMTFRMAGEHPEIFAAVAPVSGTIGGKATPESDDYIIPTPNYPLSIVQVHGRQDLNVMYTGGLTESGYQLGIRSDLSVNESVQFWVNNDQCNKIPTTLNSTKNKITLDRYSGGKNNTEVVLVTLNEENHFWENMNEAVKAEQFYGESLAEMIWTLLSQYTRI
jgi:polyhydroxybutyrate depolymerase